MNLEEQALSRETECRHCREHRRPKRTVELRITCLVCGEFETASPRDVHIEGYRASVDYFERKHAQCKPKPAHGPLAKMREI